MAAIATWALSACSPPQPPAEAPPAPTELPPAVDKGAAPSQPMSRGIAVYALSRGKGVPEAARAALAEARNTFAALEKEGLVVETTEQRIGIEGERRVCARFSDEAAMQRAFEKLRAQSQNTELLNIAIEPCDEPSPGSGDKP